MLAMRSKPGFNRQAALLAEALSCQQFLQLLSGVALKSLRATSIQLRTALQTLTKSVRLKANMDVLVKNYFFIESLHFRHPTVLTMSVMSGGQWLHLKKLILRGQNPPELVKPEAMTYLTRGQWPALEAIDLSCNDLSAEAMAQLAHAIGQS